MSYDSIRILITNAEVKWCSIIEPNEKVDPAWKSDLLFNDESMVQMPMGSAPIKGADAVLSVLSEKGVKIKDEKDDKGNPTGRKFVSVKRNVNKRTEGKHDPPRVTSKASKEPFTQMIGNGSICNFLVGTYDARFGGDGPTNTRLWLEAAQVVNHIPYAPDPFEYELEELPPSLVDEDEPSPF